MVATQDKPHIEAEEYGLPQTALILFPIFDTAKPQWGRKTSIWMNHSTQPDMSMEYHHEKQKK